MKWCVTLGNIICSADFGSWRAFRENAKQNMCLIGGDEMMSDSSNKTNSIHAFQKKHGNTISYRISEGNTILFRISGADMHSGKMWKKTGAADVVTEWIRSGFQEQNIENVEMKKKPGQMSKKMGVEERRNDEWHPETQFVLRIQGADLHLHAHNFVSDFRSWHAFR